MLVGDRGDHLGDVGLDGRKVMKWNLEKYGVHWVHLAGNMVQWREISFPSDLIEFSRKILYSIFSSYSDAFVHTAFMFRRFYDFNRSLEQKTGAERVRGAMTL
jgi:hypothetical protein